MVQSLVGHQSHYQASNGDKRRLPILSRVRPMKATIAQATIAANNAPYVIFINIQLPLHFFPSARNKFLAVAASTSLCEKIFLASTNLLENHLNFRPQLSISLLLKIVCVVRRGFVHFGVKKLLTAQFVLFMRYFCSRYFFQGLKKEACKLNQIILLVFADYPQIRW